MLEYDEWAVPGEVEYAEKKAEEIETQIQKYHQDMEVIWMRRDYPIHIQITEHVIGKFKVILPGTVWNPSADPDINNDMMLEWFQDIVAPIDETKIFDLPAGDIRNSLPEWDESLLPEASWRHIMWTHSIRYMAAEAIEHLDGDYYIIMRKFNLSETKCNKIMKVFVEKLDTQNKQIVFTELEKKIADYITIDGWNNHLRYAPWNFPLAMSEEDIINAIREAYLNASKRSRRIIPDEHDYTNMDTWHIKNCECLYQGKGGDLIVRFLFNFKDMKIVAAYPVLKEKKRIGRTLNYYDKDRKCFDWMHLYDNT